MMNNSSNIKTFRDKIKTSFSLKKRNVGGEMSNLTKNCNYDISMLITNYDNLTARSKLKAATSFVENESQS